MSKVVLVTGSSRGLGAAVAEWLGKAGSTVALVARNPDQLSQVAERVQALGGQASVHATDLTDPQETLATAEAVLRAHGRLDALVNNAGQVTPVHKLSEVSPGEWQRAVQVNLVAPALLMKALLPALRQSRGRIVNVSTGAANRPMPTWSGYCSTKAGLLMLTNVVALEEPEVICVSLRPGVVDTGMQAEIREHGHHMPQPMQDYFHGLKQKGELEHPHVPGRVCAWLALHAPQELTGQMVDYEDKTIEEAARKALGDELPRVEGASLHPHADFGRRA